MELLSLLAVSYHSLAEQLQGLSCPEIHTNMSARSASGSSTAFFSYSTINTPNGPQKARSPQRRTSVCSSLALMLLLLLWRFRHPSSRATHYCHLLGIVGNSASPSPSAGFPTQLWLAFILRFACMSSFSFTPNLWSISKHFHLILSIDYLYTS